MARAGRKKTPFYHIVAANAAAPRDGKFIELLGTYNPLAKKDEKQNVKIKDAERVKYWLGVGAEPTERTAILLSKIGILEAEKFKPIFTPKEKAPKKEKTKK